MYSIDKLVNELCPKGVDFLKIGDVCKIIPPKTKIKSVNYLDSGKYPVIDQGKDLIGGYTDEEGAFPKDNYIYPFFLHP